MSGAPDPKSRTLARGERKYRRRVAPPKQWAMIDAAKIRDLPCRLHSWSRCDGVIERHHIVERDAPHFGDDVADNILPLCTYHHDRVTRNVGISRKLLAGALTDAEYAYVVGKLGEGGMARLFGADAA